MSATPEVREAVARVLNPGAWRLYDRCQAGAFTGMVDDLPAEVRDALAEAGRVTPVAITAEQREAMGRALARRMSSAPDLDAPGWLTHVDAMLDASGIEVSR